MIAPSETLEAIRQARDSGRLDEARRMAAHFCAQWPDDSRGWLWQAWLADEPWEQLRHAERAAELEPGPATTQAIRWALARLPQGAVGQPPAPAPAWEPFPRAARRRVRRRRRLLLVALIYAGITLIGIWQGALLAGGRLRWPGEPTAPAGGPARPSAALAVTPLRLATPRMVSERPVVPEWARLLNMDEAQPLLAGEFAPPPEATPLPLPTPVASVVAPAAPASVAALALPTPGPSDSPYAPWPARQDPLLYEVQAGDNLSKIAARFGLESSTIVWANSALERNPELLTIGQELIIPALNGVWHEVKPGDTVRGIAAVYSVDPALLVWFPGNYLPSEETPLDGGGHIMVPGGKKALVAAAPRTQAAPPAPRGGEASYFGWPTSGQISQGFGPYHQAIDIAAPMHTPIFAAQSGQILYVGWDNTGYGYMILIDHHNGWYTRYAHLAGWYIEEGQWVVRGELIGLMGSTGRSTGPHLHFEIITNGYRYNPFNYLPR